MDREAARSGSGGLAACLEIARLRLVPTAVADSFTGIALAAAVRHASPSAGAVIGIAIASACLYAMGMVTNDLFDVRRDRVSHPDRALPTGAIGVGAAALLAFALGGTGLLAGSLVSPSAGLGCAVLAGLALAYNAGGKRIPVLGTILMGACRSANLLLGALAVIDVRQIGGETAILYAACLLGFYIAVVTAVSLLEDRPHSRGLFVFKTAPLFVVPALLVMLGREGLGVLLNAMAFAGLLAWATSHGYAAATVRPPQPPGAPAAAAGPAHSPHPAELFVRSALTGIFFLDAGFLIGAGLPHQAGAIYGLLILAWLWRRRWLQSHA